MRANAPTGVCVCAAAVVRQLCGWNHWYAPVGAAIANSWRIAADCDEWANVYVAGGSRRASRSHDSQLRDGHRPPAHARPALPPRPRQSRSPRGTRDRRRRHPSPPFAVRTNEALGQYAGPGAFNDPDMLLGSATDAPAHLTPTQVLARVSRRGRARAREEISETITCRGLPGVDAGGGRSTRARGRVQSRRRACTLRQLGLSSPARALPWASEALCPRRALPSTQVQTQFSLWAVMAAPLLIGSRLRDMPPSDLATYANAEVIEIDQDALGVQGHVVWSK